MNAHPHGQQTAPYRAAKGTFYGAGVGPGDPLLLTLKTHWLIQTADVISYIATAVGQSQARSIAEHSINMRDKAAIEVPVPMPMNTDRTQANAAYDQGAQTLSAYLAEGLAVVFLCEGDPLFFGSFSYLLQRLSHQHPCHVVPGISSVHASAAALQQPLTVLQESLAIISGRHTDAQIRHALETHDSLVIMKAGRARPRILAQLRSSNRWQDGNYLEYIGRPNQRIITDLDQLADEPGPYFSLFLVLKQELRPTLPTNSDTTHCELPQ